MPVQVLLVDSSQSEAHLVKTTVQEHSPDVKITVAKDPQTAAILLFDPGFNPQLIIADFHKQIDNCDDLFRRSEIRGVPLIVFSTGLSPGDVAELLKLGAREYVPKPVRLSDFEEAVRGIISQWVRPQG